MKVNLDSAPPCSLVWLACLHRIWTALSSLLSPLKLCCTLYLVLIDQRFKDTEFFQIWASCILPCASGFSQATSLNCVRTPFTPACLSPDFFAALQFYCYSKIYFLLEKLLVVAVLYHSEDRFSILHRAVILVPIPRICCSKSLVYGKECILNLMFMRDIVLSL